MRLEIVARLADGDVEVEKPFRFDFPFGLNHEKAYDTMINTLDAGVTNEGIIDLLVEEAKLITALRTPEEDSNQ